MGDKYPQMQVDPLDRPFACYDAVEIFGQSESMRAGFKGRGLACHSFDCRNLANLLGAVNNSRVKSRRVGFSGAT